MGDCEACTPVWVESTLKYHSDVLGVLTSEGGQCLVGSLTGAVSSQRVTEEHEGWLITVGHREDSAMAEASLTAVFGMGTGGTSQPSSPDRTSSQTFKTLQKKLLTY